MRIAIYQENPGEARRLSSILREAGHHVVITEGRIGLVSLLNRSTMDLVVSDWQVERPATADLVYRVTSSLQKTALIFSSVNRPSSKFSASAETGDVDYIFQPVDDDEFLRRISLALKRAHPRLGNSDPFKVGRYFVDPSEKTIARDNKTLADLGEAVFRLAYCFLANVGRPLSRDYLREFMFFGATADITSSRYLDSQISVLRSSLGFTANEPLALRTIYDFGYVLEQTDPIPQQLPRLLTAAVPRFG